MQSELIGSNSYIRRMLFWLYCSENHTGISSIGIKGFSTNWDAKLVQIKKAILAPFWSVWGFWSSLKLILFLSHGKWAEPGKYWNNVQRYFPDAPLCGSRKSPFKISWYRFENDYSAAYYFQMTRAGECIFQRYAPFWDMLTLECGVNICVSLFGLYRTCHILYCTPEKHIMKIPLICENSFSFALIHLR